MVEQDLPIENFPEAELIRILNDLEVVENLLQILVQCNYNPESDASDSTNGDPDADEQQVLTQLVETEMLIYEHKKMLIKYAPKTSVYPTIVEEEKGN